MKAKPDKRRILVVEDDQVYRELLAFGLTVRGYVVYVAEHGARAMEVIEEAAPHVVLVDLLMPVMDGLRFLDWLRKESGLRVPSLVLTCMDSKSFAVDALVAGATDVLNKPVDLDLLVRKIEAILHRGPVAADADGEGEG